jgi:hypothetical protein
MFWCLYGFFLIFCHFQERFYLESPKWILLIHSGQNPPLIFRTGGVARCELQGKKAGGVLEFLIKKW